MAPKQHQKSTFPGSQKLAEDPQLSLFCPLMRLAALTLKGRVFLAIEIAEMLPSFSSTFGPDFDLVECQTVMTELSAALIEVGTAIESVIQGGANPDAAILNPKCFDHAVGHWPRCVELEDQAQPVFERVMGPDLDLLTTGSA